MKSTSTITYFIGGFIMISIFLIFTGLSLWFIKILFVTLNLDLINTGFFVIMISVSICLLQFTYSYTNRQSSSCIFNSNPFRVIKRADTSFESEFVQISPNGKKSIFNPEDENKEANSSIIKQICIYFIYIYYGNDNNKIAVIHRSLLTGGNIKEKQVDELVLSKPSCFNSECKIYKFKGEIDDILYKISNGLCINNHTADDLYKEINTSTYSVRYPSNLFIVEREYESGYKMINKLQTDTKTY